MTQLGLAISLAAEVFKNKTDKSGQPYILHCLRVMNAMDQTDSELMQIAILHDLVEDTEFTFEDLKRLKFSQRVIDALILLTHLQADSYDFYIKKLAFNKDAVKVKLADLKDNSDITRLKGLTKSDFDRVQKYHTSFTYLSKL